MKTLDLGVFHGNSENVLSNKLLQKFLNKVKNPESYFRASPVTILMEKLKFS